LIFELPILILFIANRNHDKRSRELATLGPGSAELDGLEGVTMTNNDEIDRRNGENSTENQIIDYGTGSGDSKSGILDTISNCDTAHIDDSSVFEVENKRSPDVVLTDPANALEERSNMKFVSNAVIGSRIDVLPATDTSSIDSEVAASGSEMETIGNLSTAKDEDDSNMTTEL